jgi:2-C-methyl-D-erythritol 4-phosphate cytidylyltransferase
VVVRGREPGLAAVVAIRYWLVVPAAGSGRRFGSETPKQYCELLGRAVIVHALAPFLDDRRCVGAVVALAADDRRWPALAEARHPKVRTVVGGVQRRDSVAAGLAAVAVASAGTDPWVLVHDAARPCLPAADLEALLAALPESPDVALLAAPVADTLKEAADGRVARTIPRDGLWHALTPQAFRLTRLRAGLAAAPAATDESHAVEALGDRPRLVTGAGTNVKITRPADLELARRLLQEGRP